MARRRKNSGADVLDGLAAVFTAIIYVVRKIISLSGRKKRKELLMGEYGDEDVVTKIMRREIWIGETSAQLIESLGKPEDMNFKDSRTNNREVWKYDRRGKNRYGLRITLENSIVTEISRTGHD